MTELMSNGLTYVVALIITLGVLIAFHEYGHFWVARRLGVKVLRFSIGFGKPLWSRRSRHDGTEYVLAAIPLGGYVKMLDEREAPVAHNELEQAFNRKSVWSRIAIVSAGPIFNFIFAIAAFAAMYMIGINSVTPLLKAPIEESIAARGGFQEGDLIVSVAGKETTTLNATLLALVDHATAAEVIEVEVLDDTERRQTRTLDLRSPIDVGQDSNLLQQIGLVLWQPPFPAVIDKVVAGGAAEAAGLQGGDEILSVDGEPVSDWIQWANYVRERPEQTLAIVVARNGREFDLMITPQKLATEQGTIGRVGAYARLPDAETLPNRMIVRHGFFSALWQGAIKTWDMTMFTLRMLGRMITGQVSLDNISGPITIAQFAGQSAQLGITTFLSFMALVSISLGVLNLLPVPVLDGGHLLYYLIEVVKGSPLSEAAQQVGQRIGIAMIVMLMSLALFNDFTRLLG